MPRLEYHERQLLHPLGLEDLIDREAADGYRLVGQVDRQDGASWFLFLRETPEP